MKNKVVVSFLTFLLIVVSNFFVGFTIVLPDKNTKELSFCGSGETIEQTETIPYIRKETEEYKIKSSVPNYCSPIPGTGCANVAGAVIIGYYDRFCENLLLNCKTYMQLGSIVKYLSINSEIEELITELKNFMGTDNITSGTTFSGYQQGMRTYVNNHNYSYSTQDLGKLNFEKYVSAVESDKPVVIFLSNYSILTGSLLNENYDVITNELNTTAHVVVGFGYKIDTYYNSNNTVIAKRTYLNVASGLDMYGLSYLCLDGKSKVEYAISTVIN